MLMLTSSIRASATFLSIGESILMNFLMFDVLCRYASDGFRKHGEQIDPMQDPWHHLSSVTSVSNGF